MAKHTRMGIVATGLAVTVAATVASGDAAACGGAWFPEIEVDYRPMGVAMAEKQLEAGDADAAAATIVRVMPHVAQLDPAKSTLVARAQRVLGVAIAKGGGSLDIQAEVPEWAIGHWAGDDADERAQNLAFSVDKLREISELKDGDPAAETDLAGALAQVTEHRDEARKILEKLAEKDLVATPEGYAVLAELRAQAGDESGKKLALTRCEAMAADASVCHVTAQG